jgi:hypothetical protein
MKKAKLLNCQYIDLCMVYRQDKMEEMGDLCGEWSTVTEEVRRSLLVDRLTCFYETTRFTYCPR